MRIRTTTLIFSALLIVSIAGAALVLRPLDRLRSGATLEESLYIPSAKALKRMSLGYDGLVADLYWTRAVQYFGTKHVARSQQYKMLAPLLDITTELDPNMIVAYQFGSIFLSQRPPQGAGDPEAAVALVERGIRANPNDWQLYYNLGWIQYSERKDNRAASAAFERGSRVPGAHPSLKILAAAMAQNAGDISVARFLWTQIYNTTQDKMIRANAIKRLQALQVDEDITRLQQVLENYKQANGRYPGSWAELQAIGLRGGPVDPIGNPYVLKPEGRVEVANADQLPFITKGMRPGTQPTIVPNAAQQQSIRDAADEANQAPAASR